MGTLLNAVIIADLHISNHTPTLTQRFQQLLEVLPGRCQQLYILGDLVDFWPGDDIKDHCSNTIRNALKQLTNAGVEAFIQKGNRDFLFGKRFTEHCNIQLLPDYHVTNFGNSHCESVLMMHGDLLCTDDINYQKFRRIMHTGWLKPFWYALPLAVRHRIIGKVQQTSRVQTRQKNQKIMDVNPQAVVDTLQHYQLNTLIHGHTHKPQVHRIESINAQRMVLGDWTDNYWWIEVSPNAIHLYDAPIDTPFEIKHLNSTRNNNGK